MPKFTLPQLLLCSSLLAAHFSSHAQALPQVEETTLRAHLALLSSDLFEGRGTAQRGGDLTVAYLETQAKLLGLKPANGDSYRQAVHLLGIKPLPAISNFHLQAGGQKLNLEFGKDWLWTTGQEKTRQDFQHELVFVGYGIHAPEENWDDYKGLDVRGKVLLVLSNEPQPSADEPQRFGGRALTFFGRRGHKTEEAKRRGAAGVIMIYVKENALASWEVITDNPGGEHYQLREEEDSLALRAWLHENASARLFSAAGLDFAQLYKSAQERSFKPQALNAKVSGSLQAEVRHLQQFNIAAMVPGTDAKLKDEVVIYSAHWDHLGKKADPKGGTDIIYNGAVDNATGTAALLAMAKAAQQQPARRSQLFLWVAAEEQGLLGSRYYAQHPLLPLAKTAANLNLDSMNFVGRTSDISTFGSERTELGEIAAKVAAGMQLQVAAPRVDVSGVYFRSDHFSFAKAGVPAFSVGGGSLYLQEQAANQAKRAAYGQRYHQLSDEYDPAWDLSGMREQAQFTLNLGRELANAERRPAWKPGDPMAPKTQP